MKKRCLVADILLIIMCCYVAIIQYTMIDSLFNTILYVACAIIWSIILCMDIKDVIKNDKSDR